MIRRPPRSTLFPYTRSSDLEIKFLDKTKSLRFHCAARPTVRTQRVILSRVAKGLDRKSTRLNSSHVSISYAVFCLKKKRIDSDSAARTPTQHIKLLRRGAAC